MSRKRNRARNIGRPEPILHRTASRDAPPPPQRSTPQASPVPLPQGVITETVPTPTAALGEQPRTVTATADGGSPATRARRKDQERALTAYQWAQEASEAGVLKEYETAVQGFAAALLRSGFAVAVSTLERNRERKESALLLEHLARWRLPGIAPGAEKKEWPALVRALPVVSQYMQATREMVALLGWLRRACRAVKVEGQS